MESINSKKPPMTSWLCSRADSYTVWVGKGGGFDTQVTIGVVVEVHSSESSIRSVFLKVVRDSLLVNVLFKISGSQSPKAMSDFISKYCEIVSLISRGSPQYYVLGHLAICKEEL